MQTISDYIEQITLQQTLNPLFPKQDSLLSEFSLPYTKEEAYHYLMTAPFTYLATKYFDNSYYWEFVNSNNKTEFYDLEFIYYLVTFSNQLNIRAKLPYYSTWNKDKVVRLIYPTTNYVLESNSVSFGGSYFTNVSEGFSHPFLPTFEFTGHVCLLNKTLLYEYQDIKGYYGALDSQYLSPLRPTDLSYPLGIPTEDQLTIDECQLENSYPESGDSNFVGKYQYQYTNASYNPHIKFYLYANSTSQFLLQEKPKLDYKGAALSALSLVGVKPTLIIPTIESNQQFTISQSSTNTLTLS